MEQRASERASERARNSQLNAAKGLAGDAAPRSQVLPNSPALIGHGCLIKGGSGSTPLAEARVSRRDPIGSALGLAPCLDWTGSWGLRWRQDDASVIIYPREMDESPVLHPSS